MKIKLIVSFLLLLLVSCGSNNNKINDNGENDLKIDDKEINNIEKDIYKNDTEIGSSTGAEGQSEAQLMNFKIAESIFSGNFDEAEDLIDGIEKESKYDYLYFKGRLFFEKKLYKDALSFFLKADEIKGDKKDTDVVYLIGVVYDSLGEKTKAKEYINKATKIDFTSEFAKEHLKKIEDAENGLNIIENGVTEKTEFDILYEKGRELFAKESYKEALPFYLNANKIKGDKEGTDIIYIIGVIYSNIGEIEKAREYLNEALKSDSTKKFAQESLDSLDEIEEIEQ